MSSHEHQISESLKYASYIQRAIFPSDALLDSLFPDHFIFHRPRDFVSGDFYFAARRNNSVVLAVGDCTGHGVPGALMSILGITLLKEIIAHGNFSTAGSVLNRMREHVMAALRQTGEDAEQKDGIDLALCIIDVQKSMLSFAGAVNPLYIVRNKQLYELRGDMMPVGIGAEEELPFTSHQFELAEGDCLYLFSDGFADQFGGQHGRKFKYQPFRDLMVKSSALPMPGQKMLIEQTFDAWKGNQQQLDDVLVFGLRYHTCS